jgi:hypothetical protein
MFSFKYRLYWNLHKKKWSLQDRQTGRVAHHVTAYTMYDAKFVVRPAGQAKVRREGKKNVHAFAVGTGGLRDGIATCLSGRPVTYNPYVNDTFVFADTGEPVTEVQAISVYTENGRPKVYAIPKSDVGLTN